jgi:hypothetical protein
MKKTIVIVFTAFAAIGCADQAEPTSDAEVADARPDGGACEEGDENECGGCGQDFYEPQSVPIGQPCVFFWTEDNAGDCGTVGVGACTDPNTVACSAPKPDCAP